MKRMAVLIVILATASMLRAQSTLPSGAAAKQAVREAVEAFLLHLGDHEFDKVASDLAPQSLIVVVRERPAAASGQGEWSTSYQTGAEWLEALRRNPNPVTFREPITNVTVTVDSERLAYVRADFQVLRDGKPLSHGVDQFTLVQEGGVWKIAAVAYTSQPVR